MIWVVRKKTKNKNINSNFSLIARRSRVDPNHFLHHWQIQHIHGEFSKTTISFFFLSRVRKIFNVHSGLWTCGRYLAYHTLPSAEIRSSPSTPPARPRFSRQLCLFAVRSCTGEYIEDFTDSTGLEEIKKKRKKITKYNLEIVVNEGNLQQIRRKESILLSLVLLANNLHSVICLFCGVLFLGYFKKSKGGCSSSWSSTKSSAVWLVDISCATVTKSLKWL